jgi:FkbM family methyltransferase
MSLDESFIFYSDIYSQNINTYNDYIFKSSILKNIYWEENLTNTICKYIEDGSDFLDIGSNIGLISLSIKKKIKDNKLNKIIKNIHCFECNNDTFKCLKYNTREHDEIKLYQLALSNKVELCNMTINTFNHGANFISKTINQGNETDYDYDYIVKDNNNVLSYHYKVENYKIYIPTMTLDYLIDCFKNNISVIKIDVEGFEYNVILGSNNFLEKFKPVIIIEINKINFIKTCNLLISYNYILVNEVNDDYCLNYVFIHNTKLSLFKYENT